MLGQLLLDPGTALSQSAAEPLSTEDALRRAEVPWRNLADLAVRMNGVPPDAAEPPVPPPRQRQVGERATFWVADQINNSLHRVEATLKVATPKVYMYLADGLKVETAKLQEAARVFEQRIYEDDRRYFGAESPEGVDGDPHLTILHAAIPGLAGYFSSTDTYPSIVHPYSNERKILYVNAEAVSPGSSGYYAVLAHEFQHMIQWKANRREQTWVKEGAAEVATEAANLDNSGAIRAFEAKPDTQLNAWADSKGDVVPHYGAAYLFLSYFLEHFGGYPMAAELLSGNTRGIETFDSFLARRAPGLHFEDVFAHWVVANYLDRASADSPSYHYSRLSVEVPPTETVASSTGWQDRSVHQFAADYIEVGGQWKRARLRFVGEQTTRVIPSRAHSGSAFWWSNRGDLVDTRLTHIFDLRGLSSATLRFWTWYDLEDGYDYAYVAVSRDGGLNWSTLRSTHTTTSDPNGNNLGNGFTGKSGGGESPTWVEESVDLTPYAGDIILVRFEQVTDDAYNGPGFAVDDISIPELGYFSDAEDDGGWIPMGFIRSDGQLSQRFSVQLIRFGDRITVEQLPLDSQGGAEVELDNSDGRLHKAVLVVAALTRHTTEPAQYRYAVEMVP